VTLDLKIVLPLVLNNICITEVLAKGGMGRTFLGTMVSDPNQQVVVKIPLTAEDHLLDRFKNEIRILSQLNHPNIVKFYEDSEGDIPIGNETRKLPWLAMEFVSGDSLRKTLKNKSKANWNEVHILLENVLQALDYLHSKNLCHRDIKPDNLIYDPQAKVWKLVDFGIAKEMIDNLLLTMTMAQSNPGAWDYMSPEQHSGQPVDIRSDIYSLGKTAWEALIGDVPRVGTPYPSALLGPNKVPLDVDLLIRKMVEHRPESRYQTPAEALTALREGAGVIADKEKRRKRARMSIRILKVVATTVAFGAGVWFVGDRIETETAENIVNKYSNTATPATLCLPELQHFQDTHFSWGRRYADQQYKACIDKSSIEREDMLKLFREIRVENDKDKKTQQSINFCKTYKDAFDQTEEFREIQILAINDDLEKARKLLQSTQETDLVSAQALVTQLEKRVGAIPETQSVLKLADDSLYTAATNAVNDHLHRMEYNSARSALDRYLELSELKAHRADALNAKQKVAELEDDNDWSIVATSAEKNLNQRAFPLAARDYKNYLDKWSGGRHTQDARQGLQNVVAKHFKFLEDIQDYDDFVEEFKKFTTQYQQESKCIQIAKQWLVFHCHKEICRLYSDVRGNKTQPLTALDRVNKLDWQVCEQQHREYLSTTADRFRAYLNKPDVFSENEFLYYLQRPPKECVKMSSAPSVFNIYVQSLDVSLSESIYNKIKGLGDADPRIRVNLCKDNRADYPVISELFRGLGAVNQHSFSVAIQKSFFFVKGSEIMKFILDDADLTGDNNIEVGTLGDTASGSDQTATWNFTDRTTFTLHYSMQ